MPRPWDFSSNLGADERTYLNPPVEINLDPPEAEHMEILNENGVEFEVIVKQAKVYVRGHLGDVREWHGIDRDDFDYFNPETGRGGCDDDILDNVRDLVMGDLLSDGDNDRIAAESLSNAAAVAVHEYVLAEKLGNL